MGQIYLRGDGVIISEPFAFHPHWRKHIEVHISSVSENPDELLISLEHRMADCDFITGLREPTLAKQEKATAILRKELESLKQALDGPHNLVARFEAEKTSVRSLLRNMRLDVCGLQNLLSDPNCPPPYRNLNDPIQRVRNPHLRQISLIVCDWIMSLDCKPAIPLSPTYDVIHSEAWDQGDMSFASRLVELCIWDYETRLRPADKRIRFIQTLKKTGRPRANLKTVMAEAVKLIKSNPIKT